MNQRNEARSGEDDAAESAQAGFSLYADVFKANIDSAKVYVGLIPVVLALSITFLTDLFDPAEIRGEELLYAGWVSLAVAWIASAARLHYSVEVAYLVSQYLRQHAAALRTGPAEDDTVSEDDPAAADDPVSEDDPAAEDDPMSEGDWLRKAERQGVFADRALLSLYFSALAGLVLMAAFVAVNLSELSQDADRKGSVEITDATSVTFDTGTLSVDIDIETRGRGQQFTIYAESQGRILPETLVVTSPSDAPTASDWQMLVPADGDPLMLFAVPGAVPIDPLLPDAAEMIRAEKSDVIPVMPRPCGGQCEEEPNSDG